MTSDYPQVNSGYALAQLGRALAHGSRDKIAKWIDVLYGMKNQTLNIGSRAPVSGTPTWVTLDVAHGGFATGRFAAGGKLTPHERVLASQLGLDATGNAAVRRALNLYYLSSTGQAALREMLASGRFTVTVPEEAALLVCAWLSAHGQDARAHQLTTTIAPYFDRLRFFPEPAMSAHELTDDVHLKSVGEVLDAIAHKDVPPQVLAMNEQLLVWTPLMDRLVALFLRAFPLQADLPEQVDAAFLREGAVLLAEITQSERAHRRCQKQHRRGANFSRLREFLTAITSAPALERAEVIRRKRNGVLHVLSSFVIRYGAPGSPQHVALRLAQRANAERPTHKQLFAVVAERLADVDPRGGLPREMLKSTFQREPGGAALPGYFVTKLQRTLSAPIEELVAEGIVGSSEVVAMLLPQLTANAQARGFDDPALARLYVALYRAFRKRRSLMLFHYASQVKLEELPWVAAITPLMRSDTNAAGDTLSRVLTLVLSSFPHAITPNKFVRELKTLSSRALSGRDQEHPWTAEIAADIFMGSFVARFQHAATRAADLLEGSLYARYYELDYAAIGKLKAKQRADLFAEYCASRGTGGSYVVRNGQTLEWAQIVTTHNLAVAHGLELELDYQTLAVTTLGWITRRMRIGFTDHRARLKNIKQCAYAFRQMVFYLSMLDERAVNTFFARAHSEIEKHEPIGIALAGLERVHRGGRAPQPFVGWTAGPHWLFA